MKAETFTEVDPNGRSLKIGAIVHRYVTTRHRKRGMNTVVEPLYQCSLCAPPKPWANPVLRTEEKMHSHVLSHAEKEEARYSREMAKECGMSAPLPGQLGLAAFGIGPVDAPVKKRKR